MKTVDIQGITHIEPVPDGTSEWYYGISYEHGDLYEAEEVFRVGETVKGNTVCLIHYPLTSQKYNLAEAINSLHLPCL